MLRDKQRNFIPILFHNFSNYDCHLFFKTLIDRKPDYINLSVIPKTNEEYISVNYGCLRFIDSYRFLEDSLDELVKTLKQERPNLEDDNFTILKKEFPRKLGIIK